VLPRQYPYFTVHTPQHTFQVSTTTPCIPTPLHKSIHHTSKIRSTITNIRSLKIMQIRLDKKLIYLYIFILSALRTKKIYIIYCNTSIGLRKGVLSVKQNYINTNKFIEITLINLHSPLYTTDTPTYTATHSTVMISNTTSHTCTHTQHQPNMADTLINITQNNLQTHTDRPSNSFLYE
jgi:hypothetical protein